MSDNERLKSGKHDCVESDAHEVQFKLTLKIWLSMVTILTLILIFSLVFHFQNSKSELPADLSTFLIVLSSGGIGGAVISLVENNHRIRFLKIPPLYPDESINLDFISYIFIGVVAAIVFHYFLFQYIPLSSNEGSSKNTMNLTFVPLSILSGMSGRFLLVAATNKFNSPLCKYIEVQGIEINVHYLFNRALGYLSNGKPYSAIEILRSCKVINPSFHHAYHLEALCCLEMVKVLIADKQRSENEMKDIEVSKYFNQAYENISKGFEVVRNNKVTEKKKNMINFGYEIRKLNVRLHEVAIDYGVYHIDGSIDYNSIIDSKELSDIKGRLKEIIDEYPNGASEANKYAKEELGGLVNLISK